MKIALWVLQVLLAVAFVMAGIMKLSTPLDELAVKMEWVHWVPDWMVRFIGASELLGGLGLVLPAATRIMPKLTPLAAALLAVLMLCAVGMHVMHDDFAHILPSILMGALAAFVAWGRWKKAPIAAR